MKKSINVFIGCITVFITTIVLCCVVAAIVSWPTMLLWNWLMPDIFGLPEISIWQSLGLILLSAFLIKSPLIKNQSS